MERPEGAQIAITFLYYKDLEGALRFYTGVLGLPLVIDQGWSKILRLCPGAHVGLVDEARGMNRWQAEKCVQLCLRVPDVEAWHAMPWGWTCPGCRR
jgi:lactoylglutathione lyase